MRAVVCHEFTGPAALRLEDIPEPRPGTGQVRILVEACGVNFADSLISRGQYQKQPQPPFSPGFEVSGKVLELGAGDNVLAGWRRFPSGVWYVPYRLVASGTLAGWRDAGGAWRLRRRWTDRRSHWQALGRNGHRHR